MNFDPESPTPPDDDSQLSALGRNFLDSTGESGKNTSNTGRPAPWQPPTAEELAAHLPGYEVSKMLGRGGMGAVYMGRQISLDRTVAIKILSTELVAAEAGFIERFQNEARSMAKLEHPGIVAAYDFGETASGLLYIVMQYVDGTDVARMIAADGRLHTEHAMAITAHVCDALNYAHGKGIIHRDIKPANIMVGYDGVVKVADFGLAKIQEADGNTMGLTQSGMMMGTMHYMAPEMMLFGSAVDERADVYAVGVMLYHMLTGKVPHGMFELPSLQVPGLDPRYDGIIARAMREDRETRYQSAAELRSDLDAILTQPVAHVQAKDEAVALPTEVRPQRPGGRKSLLTGDAARSRPPTPIPSPKPSTPAWIWPTVIVAVALIAGGAWWWMATSKLDPVPEVTSAEVPVPTATETAASRPVPSLTESTPIPLEQTPASIVTPLAEDSGWVDLFNGRDLSGWEVKSGFATYEVIDGAIVGTTVPNSPNTFLCAARSFGDFELEFETRIDKGLNSGCQIRSQLNPGPHGGKMHGPQFEIEAGPSHSGFLYSEGTGAGWLSPEVDEEFPERSKHNLWKNGEWNHCRIIAQGPRIQTFLNGDPVGDYSEPAIYAAYSSGLIGLQVHRVKAGQGPYRVEWRNLRIRETHIGLPDPPLSPQPIIELFDGQSIDGWEIAGDADSFLVENGTIKATSTPGNLIYVGAGPQAPEFTDFDLRLKVRTGANGNSSVWIHSRPGNRNAHSAGLDVQICNDGPDQEKTGSIYRIAPVTQAFVRDGEWFELRVLVQGKTVTTFVNGEEAMTWTQPDNWTPPGNSPDARLASGTIGLQSHRAGPVWFKDIELVSFATADSPSSPAASLAPTESSEMNQPHPAETILGEWWQRVEGGGDAVYRVVLNENGASTLQTGSQQLAGQWEETGNELVFTWSNAVTCRFPVANFSDDFQILRGRLERDGAATVPVQLARDRSAAMLVQPGSNEAPPTESILGRWIRTNMDRPGSAYTMELSPDGRARWEGDEGVVAGNWKTEGSTIRVSWKSRFDFVLNFPDASDSDVLSGRAEWPDGKTSEIVYERFESESGVENPHPDWLVGHWNQTNGGMAFPIFLLELLGDGTSRFTSGRLRTTGHWRVEGGRLTMDWNNGAFYRVDLPASGPTDELTGFIDDIDGIEGKTVPMRMKKVASSSTENAADSSGRTASLFDGESLHGWKIEGDPSSFSVIDGMIMASSIPGNLIYVGEGSKPPDFTDFDLRMKVRVGPNGNSGVWIHLDRMQGPFKNLEAQICNNQPDDKRTGALWAVQPAKGPKVRDGEWFDFRVQVRGNTVTTYVNGEVGTTWTQPTNWKPPTKMPNAFLGTGTIRLQSHRGAPVWFKDIELTLP